ncbi:hypothetical protein Ddye_004692 [Dipteronia dyeriana]|uniref:Uncharacterized protein n=1 Tax=Dipteronia dyeriana TaxID=168575 RepID=A0AAD9XEV6_9ROSI|nr:hypothetical protein Ddye_004692 [Dipteronia dyeriana]
MAQLVPASEPHVAVLAFPFSTHAAPLLSIISRLASAAPNTLFSFFNTAESNNSLFSTHKHYFLPNVKAYNVSDGVSEGYVFIGKPQEDIELFMKAAPDTLRKAVAEAEAETRRKVSCLVNDGFLWFAAKMAEEMEVPFVPCWLSGSSSLSAYFFTDLIRETIGLQGIEGREDELLKFIPGMSKVCIRDLPEGVLFGNLQSIFSHMLHQMGLKLPQGEAVVINSFEELDPTINNDLKSKFNQFPNVGPLNLISPPPEVPDTSGCLPWLNRQKHASVAYLGFGSVSRLSPNEIVAVAEALEASKVPFIWTLKKNLQAHLPKTKLMLEVRNPHSPHWYDIVRFGSSPHGFALGSLPKRPHTNGDYFHTYIPKIIPMSSQCGTLVAHPTILPSNKGPSLSSRSGLPSSDHQSVNVRGTTPSRLLLSTALEHTSYVKIWSISCLES